jgi:hypothetical protein
MRTQTQHRITMWAAKALYIVFQVLAMAGATLMVALSNVQAQCRQQVYSPALGDGPSPAAQTSANMPQARNVVYYNSVFMQWLYINFNKLMLCKMQPLPEKSGQTVRNYMSNTLAPDLVQQTEGTIGPPEQISVNFKDITVGQWANYTNLSDFAYMTSISNDLVEYQKILAYQLGYTIDDLVMMVFDYLRTLDARTSNQDSTQAPYYFSKSIIEQMPASLAGANVLPMDSGFFNGSIHNFFIGDLWLDSSNNSLVDIWKHTEAGQMRLVELSDSDKGQGSVRIMELAGARWRPSNNQTQTANWQGSGQTGLSTYLAGNEAVIAIEFPNARHTKVDPRWQNLNVWQGPYTERTAYDPNGLIYGGAGYNCITGFGLPPDINSRARIAIAVPQTS